MRAVNQHHILRTVSFIIIFLISSSPFYFSFYFFFSEKQATSAPHSQFYFHVAVDTHFPDQSGRINFPDWHHE